MKAFADGWFQVRTEYLEFCGLPLYLHAFAGDDGIVLLDSGVAVTPETSIRPELAAAGLAIEDIRLVVNSHAHPDHMGGNANLAAVCDPVFAGPAAEAEWLEDNDLLIDQLWEPNPDAYRLSPAERDDLLGLLGGRPRVGRLLRDGDRLDLGGAAVEVITVSGHSPGHLAAYDADRSLLFTFDDVQGAGVPIAHTDTYLAPLYHDVRRYSAGLKRLDALDFTTMLPAHGDPMDAEAGHARIGASLEFLDRAGEFVSDFLDRHDHVRLGELAHDLGTRLGPYGGINLQTMSVAKAHLDDLVRRGEVAPLYTRIAKGVR
jgi:glyoxylase-like metal-dependent hydrolase (beta-lactamase superfamily II)